jgi:ribosomal protein S18 acetylase RimI-like enzyme
MRAIYTDGSCIVQLMGPIVEMSGGYIITHIGTLAFGRRRGHGHAQAVMTQVLADADAEGVALGLSVQPDPDVDYERLVTWYEELGFRFFIEDDLTAMRRDPQSH